MAGAFSCHHHIAVQSSLHPDGCSRFPFGSHEVSVGSSRRSISSYSQVGVCGRATKGSREENDPPSSACASPTTARAPVEGKREIVQNRGPHAKVCLEHFFGIFLCMLSGGVTGPVMCTFGARRSRRRTAQVFGVYIRRTTVAPRFSHCRRRVRRAGLAATHCARQHDGRGECGRSSRKATS